MDLLGMLGINRNDVLDFYKLLERGVEAMEGMARALEDIKQDTLSIEESQRNTLNMAERGK